jgi:ubiquinone/menaquinone biosynthesis C-methylase UbiE
MTGSVGARGRSKKLSDYTAVKYRGAMAATYEPKRVNAIRWNQENEIVEKMLIAQRHSITRVLDVPVGTGRFLHLYQKLGCSVTGIDSSEPMLALARKKKLPGYLVQGSIYDLQFNDQEFDAVVCVRLLDLIEEAAMRQAVSEICRVARTCIILTIRLGVAYVLKQRTATHNTVKFKNHVARCGWSIAEQHPIFKQGWHVMRLTRI